MVFMDSAAYGRVALPNIVPFTYRDGMTFQHLLYEIRDEVTKKIPAELNAALLAAVDQVNAELGSMAQHIVLSQQEAQAAYLKYQGEIERRIMEINNRVGPEGIVRRTLTRPYTLTIDPVWPDAHPLFIQLTQDAVGGRTLTLPAGVTGTVQMNTAANALTEFWLIPTSDSWHVLQPVNPAQVSAIIDPALAKAAADNAALAKQVTADNAALADKLSAGGYLVSAFTGNGKAGERLSLFYSPDGKTITSAGMNPAYTPADGQGVRDPSLIFHNNKWYVAHTSNNGFDKDFQIAISNTAAPGTWNHHLTISGANISGLNQMWAPEFYKDTDGTVYIFFSSVSADSQRAGMYWVKAQNTALTSWSTPQRMSWNNEPAVYIDGTFINHNGKYYMFYPSGGYMERAVSDTLTGTYTRDKTGNWAGFGSGIEGPAIVRDGKTIRLYFDRYVSNTGYAYSETTDLENWTPPNGVEIAPGLLSPNERLRHGTFYPLTDAISRNQSLSAQTGNSKSRHVEFATSGFNITNGVPAAFGGYVVDGNETTDSGIASIDGNKLKFNHHGTYAISFIGIIANVTGVDRSFIDVNGEVPAVVHGRIVGGAEDVFSGSIANFKTNHADEFMTLSGCARWTGAATTGRFIGRIRVTLLSTI